MIHLFFRKSTEYIAGMWYEYALVFYFFLCSAFWHYICSRSPLGVCVVCYVLGLELIVLGKFQVTWEHIVGS